MSGPSEAARPGQVVTFYSYKGGTGRSMALANVAVLLAQRDESVLVIDWDLEAPGLHSYFGDRFTRQFSSLSDPAQGLREQPGLIDLLIELRERVPPPPTTHPERESADDVADAALAGLDWQKYVLTTDVRSLSLLKAGRFDAQYGARVNSFAWEPFFERCPPLLPTFVQELARHYRWVLIDSRTGITDVSGICTTLLPEKLVVVFTPNRQSLDGVIDTIGRATAYRRKSDDLRPLIVFPLASRIEMSEPAQREAWRFGDEKKRGYQARFEAQLAVSYELKTCQLGSYFDEVQIQQSPHFAYGEQVSVLIERSDDSLSLTRSYRRLLDYLVSDRAPWVREELESLAAGPASSAVAESILDRLGPDAEQSARLLLSRLVRMSRPEEHTPDAIASYPLDELPRECGAIAAELSSKGLLQIVPAGDQRVARLVDASLLTDWKRLRKWLDEDRAFLLARQKLAAHTSEWIAGEKKYDLLLRGAPLAEARALAERRPADFSAREIDYLTASGARVASRRTARFVSGSIIGGVLALTVAVLTYTWRTDQHRKEIDGLITLALESDSLEFVQGASTRLTELEVPIDKEARVCEHLGDLQLREHRIADAQLSFKYAEASYAAPTDRARVVRRQFEIAVGAGDEKEIASVLETVEGLHGVTAPHGPNPTRLSPADLVNFTWDLARIADPKRPAEAAGLYASWLLTVDVGADSTVRDRFEIARKFLLQAELAPDLKRRGLRAIVKWYDRSGDEGPGVCVALEELAFRVSADDAGPLRERSETLASDFSETDFDSLEHGLEEARSRAGANGISRVAWRRRTLTLLRSRPAASGNNRRQALLLSKLAEDQIAEGNLGKGTLSYHEAFQLACSSRTKSDQAVVLELQQSLSNLLGSHSTNSTELKRLLKTPCAPPNH